MGLIGLALYAICSVNPPWSVTDRPRADVPRVVPGRPGQLDAGLQRLPGHLDHLTAVRTAAGLPGPAITRSFDLSALRSFVVGSEPVPADGLREFEAIAKECGLSPLALCPGYGMAEAALAVAIDPPTSPWSSVRVDPEALAAREWREVGRGRNGARLVRAAGAAHRGPHDAVTAPRRARDPEPITAQRVRRGAPSPLTADGWLHTADLGYVRDGEVFIAGRTDDVLIVAGRNIDARALDEAVGPRTRPAGPATPPASRTGRDATSSWPSPVRRRWHRTSSVPGRARSAFALARPVRRDPVGGRLHRARHTSQDAQRQGAPEPPPGPVGRGQAATDRLGLTGRGPTCPGTRHRTTADAALILSAASGSEPPDGECGERCRPGTLAPT